MAVGQFQCPGHVAAGGVQAGQEHGGQTAQALQFHLHPQEVHGGVGLAGVEAGAVADPGLALHLRRHAVEPAGQRPLGIEQAASGLQQGAGYPGQAQGLDALLTLLPEGLGHGLVKDLGGLLAPAADLAAGGAGQIQKSQGQGDGLHGREVEQGVAAVVAALAAGHGLGVQLGHLGEGGVGAGAQGLQFFQKLAQGVSGVGHGARLA